MKTDLLAIIPTYSHWEYADRTVRSFFAHSPEGSHCAIYDDASRDYRVDGRFHPIIEKLSSDFMGRFWSSQFAFNGGYIRSLNQGLREGRAFEYILCGNSDIVFTPRWFEEMKRPLDEGKAELVGPVSNAPGITAGNRQDVRTYLTNYELCDDDVYLAQTAARLRESYDAKLVDGPINGFCMLARSLTWWLGSYDDSNVFCPFNEHNSKGLKNPTPTMTLNEDELQSRWAKKNWRSRIVPSSFVFHYRSVSRGDRFKKPGWYRMKP